MKLYKHYTLSGPSKAYWSEYKDTATECGELINVRKESGGSAELDLINDFFVACKGDYGVGVPVELARRAKKLLGVYE